MASYTFGLIVLLCRGTFAQRSDRFLGSRTKQEDAPVPDTPWAKLPNVNCYMDKYPYDHGAEENLNGGQCGMLQPQQRSFL